MSAAAQRFEDIAVRHGLNAYFVAEVYCSRCGFLRIATPEPLPESCPCPRCNRIVAPIKLNAKIATRRKLPLWNLVSQPVLPQILRQLELAERQRLRQRPAREHEYRDPATGKVWSVRFREPRPPSPSHAVQLQAEREARQRRRDQERAARDLAKRQARTERRALRLERIDRMLKGLSLRGYIS